MSTNKDYATGARTMSSILVEAERLVVSSLLCEKGIWGAYGKRVRPELIRDPDHKALVRAMHAVSSKGSVVDLLTVRAYLEANGGEQPDIQELLRHASEFGVSSIDSAIAVLEEEFIRNEVTAIGMDVFQQAGNSSITGSQLLASATTRLRALEGSLGRSHFDPDLGYDHILDAAVGASSCVSTGLPTLDAVLGGGLREGLTLVAGRPGHGKTSLALGIALHAAMRLAITVQFFSLEMSHREMTIRAVCMLTGIPFNTIQQGTANSHEKAEIRNAVAALKGKPLYFDDRAGLSIEEIAAETRIRKSKLPDKAPGLILADHAGFIGAFGRFNTENDKQGRISKLAKGLSKETGWPFVMLNQLSRVVEGRRDHHPILSDLRDSGNWEQDADVVIFNYRHEKYFPGVRVNEIDVEVAKQRNGPAGPATDSSGGRRVFFYRKTAMAVQERS